MYFFCVVKVKCLRGLRKLLVSEIYHHYHLERTIELSYLFAFESGFE